MQRGEALWQCGAVSRDHHRAVLLGFYYSFNIPLLSLEVTVSLVQGPCLKSACWALCVYVFIRAVWDINVGNFAWFSCRRYQVLSVAASFLVWAG